MKITSAHILSVIYIAIILIFVINVKMYFNAQNINQIVNSNTEQIKLVNQQIKLLAKNDSIFLGITNSFRNSDSIRLDWVKKNNELLKENNLMLKRILTKLP